MEDYHGITFTMFWVFASRITGSSRSGMRSITGGFAQARAAEAADIMFCTLHGVVFF
jgi:hypothetical protein